MKNYTYNFTNDPLSIKSMAAEDRPREKLMNYGKASLTDAELVAILIGSGTVEVNAIQLGEQILAAVNGNLGELGKRTLKELMRFKGIGEAKAITIAAALELGRRRQLSDLLERDRITCARDAYELLLPDMIDLPHEEFWIILLNRNANVIGKRRISSGGVSKVLVDAKLVFHPALEALATGLILAHNHPSNNLKPSQEDIDLTKKLKKAGESLDISVYDHLIISAGSFYSFADAGIL
jgi:DNA repair protein RadC